MALRVAADVSLIASLDNSPNPQQIAFASGDQEVIDTTTYGEAVGHTIAIPANTADLTVDMTGVAEADMVYMQVLQPLAASPNPPIVVAPFLVKLVPVGGSAGATPWMEIAFRVPALIPFRIAEIHVQNPDATSAVILQIGIVGN